MEENCNKSNGKTLGQYHEVSSAPSLTDASLGIPKRVDFHEMSRNCSFEVQSKKGKLGRNR